MNAQSRYRASPTILALALALTYLLVAGLYIIVSTLAVEHVFDDKSEVIQIEMAKGLGFVAVTCVLLFFGSRYLLAHIRQQCREIEEHQSSIRELDKRSANGLLANAIGHDANNLLSAVSMSLELLQSGVDPERQARLFASLESVVEELTVLNKRLVRGGQADQPGELQERCLYHESERVLHFIDRDHPIKGLQLSFSREGDVSAPVNRHLYIQIMFNLLTNCVRHAGPAATVRVHIQDCGDRVCVIVEDDGPGVPEEDREHIFEPYYSKHPEGSGLGLASVRAIIRMHNGDIACETSEALGGAKFKMHFPREGAQINQGLPRESALASV